MRNSWRTALPALLLLSVGLAGCFGGDDDGGPEEAPTDGNGDTTSPEGSDAVVVRLVDPPDMASVADNVSINWTVEGEDNGTVLNITATTLAYGNDSVQDPESPDDYGNTTGNSVGTTPGNFSGDITPEEPGTLYMRVYALVDGVQYWSEEHSMEVEGAAGEEHTVRIASAALGYLSSFEPEELTIQVGDAVMWTNADDDTHTATAEDNSWDTGNIEGGADSELFVFDEAGEYDYRCSIHPQTMMGRIVVQAV